MCQSSDSRILCELSYGDQRMSEFVSRFYQGRVAQAVLDPASYRVLACENCDFIYQDPILDDEGMQKLYQDWIDNAASLRKKQAASAKLFRQYAGQIQTLMQMLGRQPRQLRVLEYGMGWGYWSRMAQAHGLEVSGYELSAIRREHARGMGLKVLDSLPEQAAQFDCIYANQVFEHLPEPLPILRRLSDLLAPGGLVYIRVPDGRGVAERLEKRGWSPELDAIHPLEHINCFTRKTLLEMAAGAGLHPARAPLRLNCGSLVNGLRREIADRLLNTHVIFRRGPG